MGWSVVPSDPTMRWASPSGGPLDKLPQLERLLREEFPTLEDLSKPNEKGRETAEKGTRISLVHRPGARAPGPWRAIGIHPRAKEKDSYGGSDGHVNPWTDSPALVNFVPHGRLAPWLDCIHRTDGWLPPRIATVRGCMFQPWLASPSVLCAMPICLLASEPGGKQFATWNGGVRECIIDGFMRQVSL